MYPPWPYEEASRTYPSDDRSTANHNEQAHGYGYSQASAPPRPLEPRPTLHTTLSEPMGSLRTQEAYQYQEHPTSEQRSRNQNLPGLKDILNSSPYSPAQNSYNSTWNSHTVPAGSYQSSEAYHIHSGIHPPMVLHPPTVANQRYHPQLDKPYELSNPETSRQAPASPLPPFDIFPDRGRDSLEIPQERQEHPSIESRLANGVPSPRGSTLPEDPSYRTQATASYRQGRTPHVVTGAENHGKYLGVEDVAGDGKYHVYADGFRIPTQVDGEQVNPAWGLTKANKPRKRLALACLDCREKKIKCEPGANSCIQCEKAMRPCRKAPDKYTQTDTATNYFIGSPVRKAAPGPDIPPSSYRNEEPDPLNKRRSRADPSPPTEPNKRHRSISPHSDHGRDQDRLRRGDASPMDIAGSSAAAVAREEPLMWENDPYAVDPEVTLHLLDLYFAHFNNATYCMFPRRHFFHWLKTSESKCQNEKMLLYAMLAAGSIYADAQWQGFGKQCAQIAGDAIASEVGRFNVSAAQAKVLLGMYHFAKGANAVAYDLAGSAIRTVLHMELNTEEGCLDDAVSKSQPRYEFAFSPAQLAECKRRTFWSCFLQDRYCAAIVCMIKPQDVFVRLPCTEEMYETGIDSNAPYFMNDTDHPDTTSVYPTSPLAPMAWLVLVAGIWGDVTDFIFRASYRPGPSYREFYESIYSQIQRRAQDWLTRAPAHLQYSKANLDQSIQRGYVGTFISMHILYHLSLIKLNRYMRHAALPNAISRNIRTANHHGHQILQIMTALHLAGREISTPAEGQLPTLEFSTPFPGYAILSAIDIVSAGGLDSNLGATLDEIDGALGCLRELKNYWNSCKSQLRACEKRYYQLKNVTITPQKAKSGCWLGKKWGIKAPLEQELAPENDCIYGLGEQEADEAMGKYWDAFKEG